MPKLTISKCVCRELPFTRLLSAARERGWSLEELVRETGCGGGCGLCRPYLARMLATGETVFHHLIVE
jgi:bacterioferritin-associated ferredoxin